MSGDLQSAFDITETTVCVVRAVPGGWVLDGGCLNGRFLGHSLAGLDGLPVLVKFRPFSPGGTWKFISATPVAGRAP